MNHIDNANDDCDEFIIVEIDMVQYLNDYYSSVQSWVDCVKSCFWDFIEYDKDITFCI